MSRHYTPDAIAKAIQVMGRKPVKPLGTCFDSSAHHVAEAHRYHANMVLCHGIIETNIPGEAPHPAAHAWVEFDATEGRLAYDAIWGVSLLAENYREQMKATYVVEYSAAELGVRWAVTDYPGPWDQRIKELADSK